MSMFRTMASKIQLHLHDTFMLWSCWCWNGCFCWFLLLFLISFYLLFLFVVFLLVCWWLFVVWRFCCLFDYVWLLFVLSLFVWLVCCILRCSVGLSGLRGGRGRPLRRGGLRSGRPGPRSARVARLQSQGFVGWFGKIKKCEKEWRTYDNKWSMITHLIANTCKYNINMIKLKYKQWIHWVWNRGSKN